MQLAKRKRDKMTAGRRGTLAAFDIRSLKDQDERYWNVCAWRPPWVDRVVPTTDPQPLIYLTQRMIEMLGGKYKRQVAR